MSGCDWIASDGFSTCGKPASHIRQGLLCCDEHVTEWDDTRCSRCQRPESEHVEWDDPRCISLVTEGSLSTSVATAGVHLTAEMFSDALSSRPPPIRPIMQHAQAVDYRGHARALGISEELPLGAIEGPAPFGCACPECVSRRESPHHRECGRLWSEHTITPGGMVCP